MDVSPLVRSLLEKRGIVDAGEQERFLVPSYERDTHDPFSMADMDRAVARILLAMEEGERIAVYADFDCDGIPGAALLSDVFKKIGYENFEVYIPHRDEEGYGFHAHAIDTLKEHGVSLIITVDVGTVAHAGVAHARENGIDVIVTDHHEIGAALPECIVINPKRTGAPSAAASPLENGISLLGNSSASPRQSAEFLAKTPPQDAHAVAYPFPGLCGTGVAFKVAQALLREGKKRELPGFIAIPDGWEKWLLDLVAIATVADLVPLTGENRALVYFGLTVLRKSRRPGIIALCAQARLKQGEITEEDISFSFAPRINAASRMGDPELALRLLTTDSREEAEAIAAQLERLNASRKTTVASIVKEAKRRAKARFTDADRVAVLGDPEWKPALMGLVANSLMNERGGVVCVWGRDAKGKLKGSCRSDGSVSVVELFAKAKHVLEEAGGHHASGGFTAKADGIHALPDAFAAAHTELDGGAETKEAPAAELVVSLREVSWTLYQDIARLAPYGVGNPKPLVQVRAAVAAVKRFGKEKNHVEVVLADDARSCRAFQFFAAPESFACVPAPELAVVVTSTIERDSYRGARAVALRLVQIEAA